MTVWLKQGVLGQLQIPMRRAVGKLAEFYASKGKDLFITSMCEGTHSSGSLHYDGFAVDFRRGGEKLEDIKALLGTNFVVLDYPDLNIFHVGYDPLRTGGGK